MGISPHTRKALGYESFKEYGEKELNFASTHIYRLADAAEIALQIGFSPIGEISLQIGFSPDSAIAESQPKETHLRPLKSVPEEDRETDRLIKRHINTTRYLLLDMRDRKGWKALGYESFKAYGEKELGYQENYIHKLVNAAEISLQIGFDQDCTIVQPTESQLRPLKSVPEEDRKAIWEEATRLTFLSGAMVPLWKIFHKR